MFALPAAALAIYQEAKPVAKKAVLGIMASAALVLVPHGGHRAARVRLHVRRLAAVHHPRGPHGHGDGAHQRTRDQGRVRVQRRPVRLRPQLEHRDETVPAHPHRDRLRLPLLLPVPVRHPQVEPADARPRGGGRGVARGSTTPSPRRRAEPRDPHRRPRRPPSRARRARLGGDQRRAGHRRRRGHPAGAGRPAPPRNPGPRLRRPALPRRRGAAFTTGDPAEAATVIATHRAHGTTSLVASLVTDTEDSLVASVRGLAPLVRAGELAGIHLEGPWLSAAHCGAHDPTLLRAPTPPRSPACWTPGAAPCGW